MLNDVIIKICNKGDYTNIDSISNVISYCSGYGAVPIGGYGFWPVTYIEAINQFELVYNTCSYTPERNIWHLILSFRKNKSASQVLYIANHIATLFCNEYLVLYGIHNKRETHTDRGFHLHFAILPTSYMQDVPELTLYKMLDYIVQINNLMKDQYGLSPKFEGLIEGLKILGKTSPIL